MKCDERNCWGCAWRAIIGPVDDPTLCCGHTSHQVRNSFAGYTTAENCKAYLRDDPGLKIKVKRDTREMLMKGIHQFWTTLALIPTIAPKRSPAMTLMW